MLLFFLGITTGMMSTIVAHKREAEKLNDQLKQTNQLVQDLHEEIEMKDLLTIKVLGNRDLEKKPDYGKTEDYVAISKIEAELEAELERLQSNMKPSSLETISNYVEVIMPLNLIKFVCEPFFIPQSQETISDYGKAVSCWCWCPLR